MIIANAADLHVVPKPEPKPQPPPPPSSGCPPPTPKPDSEDLHLYKPLNLQPPPPPSSGCPPPTATKHPRVPDRDGRRFCRVCNDFLPVSAFPSGQRRYTCRAHLWERVGRPAKQTLLAKPRKCLLARLWMQCYKDRRVFGHARVALTQAELDAMLVAAGAGAAKFAVLPRDPRQPISRDNAVLVSQEDRRALLALARRRALDTVAEPNYA